VLPLFPAEYYGHPEFLYSSFSKVCPCSCSFGFGGCMTGGGTPTKARATNTGMKQRKRNRLMLTALTWCWHESYQGRPSASCAFVIELQHKEQP
jgi:hypothetical protein